MSTLFESDTNRRRHVCESQPLASLFTVSVDELENLSKNGKTTKRSATPRVLTVAQAAKIMLSGSYGKVLPK